MFENLLYSILKSLHIMLFYWNFLYSKTFSSSFAVLVYNLSLILVKVLLSDYIPVQYWRRKLTASFCTNQNYFQSYDWSLFIIFKQFLQKESSSFIALLVFPSVHQIRYSWIFCCILFVNLLMYNDANSNIKLSLSQ